MPLRKLRTLVATLRKDSGVDGDRLERKINNTAYTILSNLGVDAALLFHSSDNTWDSLAEACEACEACEVKGDAARAKAIRLTKSYPPDAAR
ncbi:hypothetical protein [Lysobacter sp. CA199]|uniref:hypothetical protein n=1 Tax=Lysobacter sp. CA199 TaxID=3455608 RepID=UPI003F8D001D